MDSLVTIQQQVHHCLFKLKIANGDLNLTNVVSISAGYQHNIALRKDGTVWAWGRNDGGTTWKQQY